MSRLWNYIGKQNWTADKKYRAALFILGIESALGGFLIWLIIQNWALSSWEWAVCFTGYPLVISWFVVFFYSCRHAFHDYV